MSTSLPSMSAFDASWASDAHAASDVSTSGNDAG